MNAVEANFETFLLRRNLSTKTVKAGSVLGTVFVRMLNHGDMFLSGQIHSVWYRTCLGGSYGTFTSFSMYPVIEPTVVFLVCRIKVMKYFAHATH